MLSLCSLEIAVPSGKSFTFLATLILVDKMYSPFGSGFGASKSSGLRLLLCLSSLLKP